MGKRGKYQKAHKKEWENESDFRGWLSATENGKSSWCKVCCIELRAHRTDLLKHAGTQKHKHNLGKIDKSQLKLSISLTTNSTKRKEIILASYVATHTSIRSIDHLPDILNQTFTTATDRPSTSRSEQEKLHLHRTKCAAIIKEVIAPVLLSELIEDVGDSPFSLIIDESTDVSTEKLLCLCIKYYSQNKNNIITQFVSFVSVVQTTAEDLYEAIVNILNSVGLNSKNIIGIGTDGAANLCGQHNSAYTLLKKNLGLENLVLVKCICHSLHICGSKASEVFADKVDFLVKETYNWFKNSTLRLSKYKSVYDLININTENIKGFTKLTALSATRLSRYRARKFLISI